MDVDMHVDYVSVNYNSIAVGTTPTIFAKLSKIACPFEIRQPSTTGGDARCGEAPLGAVYTSMILYFLSLWPWS